MLYDELNIKYLPEDVLIRYFKKQSSENERYIIEKLRFKSLNEENYHLIEKLVQNNNIPKVGIQSELYKKHLDKFLASVIKPHETEVPNNANNIIKLNNKIEPKAGQIWTTKAIPQPENFNIEPVVLPKQVFILTNPQPYQLLEELDYIDKYQEYYTMIVLPISIETRFATHEDYIIKAGNNILSVEFMIETWLETNMLVCNLEKYVGELDDKQNDELLNIYFAANSMEYNSDIYEKANKGKFHDKDYGDIYEYQKLEEENIEYLFEPVNRLNEFFTIEETITEDLSEPVYRLVAGDENVTPPDQQQNIKEVILLGNTNFEVKLQIKIDGQLYIRHKILNKENTIDSIIVKDKSENSIIQEFIIDSTKAIQYFHIKELLTDKTVEFSFIKNKKVISIKNINFS